ncbi:hypothetical protein [Guyparkeria sp. TX1]|uniref:hypothetical protein n=1 Tax=Guyparkeria sp. TX1 TaxID=3115001 RepID=UPI003977962E
MEWITTFANNYMTHIIATGAILQIVGTVVLTLFSFNGLKIERDETVRVNDKPVTHVSMNTSWLRFARIALVILLFGITISGLAGIIGASTA